jgi:hypothetical protein
MSEYSEYFLAPKFVIVTSNGSAVQNVFGPFDTREAAQTFADSQGYEAEVFKLFPPVQKKQSVTVAFERSEGNTNAVNTLARDLGVAWSEGFPVGSTFVLKGKLSKNEINAFRTRFGQEPWFSLQV